MGSQAAMSQKHTNNCDAFTPEMISEAANEYRTDLEHKTWRGRSDCENAFKSGCEFVLNKLKDDGVE